MPISEKVLHAIAVQIRKDLLAQEKEHDIRHTLEYFIRGRVLFDDLKVMFDTFFSKKEHEYSEMLQKLIRRHEYTEIKHDYLYMSVVEKDDPKGYTKVGDHYLQHKLFFTFKNPAHNTRDALINIQKFIDGIYAAVCEIHEKLDKEFRPRSIFGAVLRKGIITIKIPEKFIIFIGHKDSLVIHYSNKEISPKIKEIVENSFKKHNIELEKRTLFGDSGYDIMDTEMKHCKVHSQMICTAVAKRIFVNREEILGMTDAVLAQRISQEIQNAVQLEYHQMYEIMKKEL